MGCVEARTEDEEAVDDEIGVTAAQIVALVAAQFEGLRPGEITVRQYIEEAREQGDDIRYNQAASRLNRLVEQGIMARREIVYDGARRMAYRWIGEEQENE